ncbi:MAG TPA: SIMPL domain-containing protein [Bacillota bacterium]
MKAAFWRNVGSVLAVSLIGLLAAMLLVQGQPIEAQDGANPVAIDRPYLQVSGEGRIAVEPDQAVLEFGVVSRAARAADAVSANAQATERLIAALKEAGINESAIQTAHYSLHADYESREGGAPRLAGYVVSNRVRVRTTQLDRLGQLIDTAVAAGANDIGGIQFELSDRRRAEVLDRAYQQAVAAARAKAEVLAEAAGVRLGRLIAVDETGVASPPIPYGGIQRKAAEVATPIEPGTVEAVASVHLIFALD